MRYSIRAHSAKDFELFGTSPGVDYLSTKKSDCTKFYKIFLGQGLFGFHSACRRRSHGVWFEITETEWNTAKNLR